jgi:hypothetical protein
MIVLQSPLSNPRPPVGRKRNDDWHILQHEPLLPSPSQKMAIMRVAIK